jgi:tRNA(Ile)-lysidine synthase
MADPRKVPLDDSVQDRHVPVGDASLSLSATKSNPTASPELGKWDLVLQHVSTAWPLEQWRELTVAIGVSGGCDSMVLAHAVAELSQHRPGRTVVAHFNHGVRECAASDAAFVKAWADSMGWTCMVGQRPLPSGELPATDEQRLRRARFAFFRSVVAKSGARFLALAHHRDDQCETILHQLLRGTGTAGAAGMAWARPLNEQSLVVRPLLGLSREQLRAAARARGIQWREDESNRGLKPHRNWIRHRLLPMIRERYPAAESALIAFAEQARELHEQTEVAAEMVALRATKQTEDGGLWLSTKDLKNESDGVLVALLRQQWSHRGWSWQAVDRRHLYQLLRMIREGNPQSWNLPNQLVAVAELSGLTVRQTPATTGLMVEKLS